MKSAFVSITLLVLAGCAGSVRLHPVDTSVLIQQGIVYYLPLTRLKITVPYSVVEERVWSVVPRTEWEARANRSAIKRDTAGRPVVVDVNGLPLKVSAAEKASDSGAAADAFVLEQKSPPLRQIRVRDAVAVALVTVPDRRLAFRIDPAALRAFTAAAEKAKISLTPEGILQGVNVEFQDRKAAIAADWLKTGIAAARFGGAVAGRERREETVIQVVEITREAGFDEFRAEHDGSPEGAWRLNYRVDPLAGEFGAAVGSAAAFDAAARDRVTVEVRCDRDLASLSRLEAAEVTAQPPWTGASDARVLDGILFRVPAPVHLAVRVEDTPVFAASLPVAQAGGLACVPVRGRAFSDNQYGLKVSETTGGATEYTFSGSSAGERASAALEPAVISSATAALKDLDTAATQREIDRLKKEKELLEVRRALESARQD